MCLFMIAKKATEMKPLRSFFMEDFLENFRLQSEFNLGESGAYPRTTEELLIQSGLERKNACDIFLNMKLYDSPNRGRWDLRERVAQMHPGATAENVLITTGTSEALFLLFRHLNPKSVALPMPAFQLLYEIPMALHAQIIPLPIRWDEHGLPFIDESEWISILRKETPDCLLINNPHNPSGLVLSHCFLDQLSLLAQDLDCTVIGDEHYRFLSSKTDMLGQTIYRQNDHTFVTGSFIKCLGSPGLRIGWCIGPKSALGHMQNEKNYTTHTVNPFSEWISFEVLKNLNSPLFLEMKQDWIQNKNTLESFLKSSNIFYGTAPQGGLVTSLGAHDFESQDVENRLRKHGIFTLPLSSMEFGTLEFQQQHRYGNKILSGINRGHGFRLGLGIQPARLNEALNRMEDIFLSKK